MKKYILIIVSLLIVTSLSNKADFKWEKFTELHCYYTRFQDMVIDSSKNLYITMDTSIYKSTDDGQSWKRIFNGKTNLIWNFRCSSKNLYFDCYFTKDYGNSLDSTKLFVSNNDGNSFEFVKDEFYPNHSGYKIFSSSPWIKNDTLIFTTYLTSLNDPKITKTIVYYKSVNDSTWSVSKNFYDFLLSKSFIQYLFIDKYGNMFAPKFRYDSLTPVSEINILPNINDNYKICKGSFSFNFLNDMYPNVQLFSNDIEGNLWCATVSSLIKYNYETKEWNNIETPFSIIYNLRANGSSFYFLTESKLIVTHDSFKSFDSLKLPFKINSDFSRLYITPKGTLLLLDNTGYLWRGVETSDVQENISNLNMQLSPNPATDFLEISYPPSNKSGLGGVSIEIFSVLGIRLLSTPVNPTPTLSMLGEGVRIDVSAFPQGIYFVKVGNFVTKFIKI